MISGGNRYPGSWRQGSSSVYSASPCLNSTTPLATPGTCLVVPLIDGQGLFDSLALILQCLSSEQHNRRLAFSHEHIFEAFCVSRWGVSPPRLYARAVPRSACFGVRHCHACSTGPLVVILSDASAVR